MQPFDAFPASICPIGVLKTIGENIIIADTDYRIVWFNPTAYDLFAKIGPLFGLSDPESFIGVPMDRFHKTPSYQRAIMAGLKTPHRMRIDIKNTYVADIVINPITDSNDNEIKGYVVMLMDVTTMAQEEKRKDQLIQDLSVPMVHVWDHTMACPIIGPLDDERFDRILTTILTTCQQNKTKYMVVNFSGVTVFNQSIPQQLDQIIDCLRIIGTVCLVVGIQPDLAYHLVSGVDLDPHAHIFATTKEALQFVMSFE